MFEMMQMLLQVMQLRHWLVIAGCALVIFGSAGLLIRAIRTPKTE